MVLQILLIVSIILQLSAASVAIGLTRKTKYNLSWILFTIGLTVLAFLRFCEYIQQTDLLELHFSTQFLVWLGVITSLCFAVGVFVVRKIFSYIYRVEQQRRLSERRILNTILRTEEKERQRFSKDLHDGLGPLLSSAKMSLSALSTAALDERNTEILKNASYVIDESIRSIREISINLSPHVLKDFGLSRAVSTFIHKLSPTETEIKFQTNLKDERFDMDIEVILYRVLCELINNSLKHADASLIQINLFYGDDLLSIHYRDDGSGFDMSQATHQGMGFSNISSRISSLKGGLSITSTPGEGMEAKIDVPVQY